MTPQTQAPPALPGVTLREHVPLATRTSLRLGGAARFFAEVREPAALPELLDWAEAAGLPVTLLGGGTNVVVADAGVPGLVLSIALCGQSVATDGERVRVSVAAGEPWDGFVAACVERNWAGVECLSGIPGQVGATPIQNVGAYGQDVGASLVSVDVYDAATRQQRTLAHAECGFGYRTSRFKAADAGRFIVLGATFELRVDGEACLAYPDIARRFSRAGGEPPTLGRVRSVVLETRREKSMLLDESDDNARSCGSFFLNPELTRAQFDALSSRTPAPPGYPQPDGRVKVPAGWLIEQSGFRRGQSFGAVGISSRHALALVCHDGATARQLIELAHRVRDGVARAFGIQLAPEPRFMGFGTPSDQLPPL